ncbi:MAG: DNRLRE domain-containing protein [Lysobacterales bacterium]|nr:MAG: DNRLRE domain-containing protein [Xanthomonadales bacterium]
MKHLSKLAVMALLTLLAAAPLFAASVVRGPYLQLQTDAGVTVRWRTDAATDSVVRFGATPGNLNQSVTVPGLTTEHTVRLDGLAAGQQFWYSVGDRNAPLAGDATFHFHTAPVRGEAAATRIWVIGDSGTADANARAVRDAYLAWAASNPADLWLMLGDNAYNSGTDAEFQAAVFNTYPTILRQLPLWPTLGNHDGATANSNLQSGPYYDIFNLPKAAEAGGFASGTEAYYSFDYANIHFVCLDSYETDRSVNGVMMEWLQADLALNDQPWVIAFFHHPPYSKGSHNSDTETALIDMRQNALPILEAWGVDLVLTGHSHSYERSYLLDGHYGVSTSLNPLNHVLDPGDGRESGDGAYEKPDLIAAQNAGAVYAVAGSSGKISGGALNHPAMFVSLNSLGSMVLDVTGNRLDAVFLDQAGATRDSFTLVKTPDAAAPLITGASAEDASHVLVDFNERLDSAAAENPASYAIAGLAISQAQLLAGDARVRLTTSPMTDGTRYTLIVNDVQDLIGNTILPDSSVDFDYFERMTVAFQDGLAPDPGYAGTRDAYIRQAAPDTAHGLATSLQVDGDDPAGSGNDLNILLAWDLGAIPAGAIVEAASIRMEVTNLSTGSYTCYALLTNWVEAQTTWNRASTAAAWGAAGAASAADRDSTPLCTVSAAATGALTVPLNAAGLARVQSWIDAPTGNHGLVIGNSATTDGADFHASESGTAVARPRLEVTYRVGTPPANQAPLAGFTVDCNALACNFSDTSSDGDGTVSAWFWDFGDGATSAAQHPAHSYTAAGDYTVTLTVTDDDGASDDASELVTVSVPPDFIDQFAQADLPAAGSVVGTFTDTHADDGLAQSITERESGGKRNTRYSYLSHTWRFQVAPGASISLHADAWSGGSGDGDAFVFAWSGDNVSFTNLFTVSSASPANPQSAAIPASGTLYVRVSDSNRQVGNLGLDTVFIDQLYIRSDSATVPEPPAAPTNLLVTASTSDSLSLSWQHPATDETGFELQRAPTADGAWLQVAAPGGGSSAHTDGGLLATTPYFYRIRAINGAGASAWSNVASGTTAAAAAITLTASGSKNRGFHVADLAWSGATGNLVDIVRDGAIIATTANDGIYQDNTGNKGTRSYVYRVCQAGTSACSNDVTLVF